MTAGESPNDRKVVIDAGAAIKLQRLERFGKELFTTGGVHREVRDEKARALLNTLPVELKIREPKPEDMAYVRRFAKMTGDIGFLSQNDMDLIALTVSIWREERLGPLREKPAILESINTNAAFEWAPVKPSETSTLGSVEAVPEEAATDVAAGDDADDGWEVAGAKNGKKRNFRPHAKPMPMPVPVPVPAPTPAADEPALVEDENTDVLKAVAHDENDETVSDCDCDSDTDGSSAGEWVTDENITHFGKAVEPAVEMKVTCASSDYSVQNVLLQMGIQPLTFDGYAVRGVKLWGLVCRACFHFSRDTTKMFCAKCGNDTCVRVPIVVGENGQPTVLNSGRRLRKKGTVFAIPKPRGGRGWKPIFAEDEVKLGGRDVQLRAQQRLAEQDRMAHDPFHEDCGGKDWYHRSVTSTGKRLDTRAPKYTPGYGRKNPNASNFNFRGKK